jgi:hypothetical protein
MTTVGSFISIPRSARLGPLTELLTVELIIWVDRIQLPPRCHPAKIPNRRYYTNKQHHNFVPFGATTRPAPTSKCARRSKWGVDRVTFPQSVGVAIRRVRHRPSLWQSLSAVVARAHPSEAYGYCLSASSFSHPAGNATPFCRRLPSPPPNQALRPVPLKSPGAISAK